MRLAVVFVVAFYLASSVLAQAPTREQKVRGDKAKVEAEGFWIYNDLPRANAEAKASGRPIVVVMRCIPCEQCVKLDDDLAMRVLRFHGHCPFGKDEKGKALFVPALVTAFRPLRVDDEARPPQAIHRIGLKPDGSKLGKKMLG